MAASLYIHIPFCVRKCEYCDFYSGVAGDADIERYLHALDRELALRFPRGFAPATVFIGGGAPPRRSAGEPHTPGGAFRLINCTRWGLHCAAMLTCQVAPNSAARSTRAR